MSGYGFISQVRREYVQSSRITVSIDAVEIHIIARK